MGKLIVIEGIDGSGKSTQLSLLKNRLDIENIDYEAVSFPRYDEPSSALIKMYLGGELGTHPGDVHAYAASTFFAVDRFASYKKEPWGKYYDGGGLILMDRYTTSNAVHQGAKLPRQEQAEFFKWLYDFEFRLIGLPEPDLVLYMDIAAETALMRIRSREEETDIHERDFKYIESCTECLKLAASTLGWTGVNANLRETEIHEQIFAIIKKEII